MNLMDRYVNYYKPLLRTYCTKLVEQMPADEFHGIPHPFIPAWGTRYEQAIVKMAIIGLRQLEKAHPDLLQMDLQEI